MGFNSGFKGLIANLVEWCRNKRKVRALVSLPIGMASRLREPPPPHSSLGAGNHFGGIDDNRTLLLFDHVYTTTSLAVPRWDIITLCDLVGFGRSYLLLGHNREQQLHSGYLYPPNYTASHIRRLWSYLNMKVGESVNRSGSDGEDKNFPHACLDIIVPLM